VTAAPLPAPGNLRRQRWGREQPADLTTREAAEVGNAGSVREDALVIDIVRKPHRCIVTLRGELSLQTAGALATALSKVLVEGRPVLVDLSGFWVGWAPALSVFPATMAAAGGWPHARMVLFDAEPELAGALHRVGVPLAVPLEPTLQAAVQRLGTRPARLLRWYELDRDVGAPRRARALVRGACVDWGITACAAEAELVASELVTNAVEHAATACRLRIELDARGLRLGVRDQRRDRVPRLAPRGQPGSRGHGLRVVAAICARWGVTPHGDGKTVWAVLTCAARPAADRDRADRDRGIVDGE
jgi:hypothetical protein